MNITRLAFIATCAALVASISAQSLPELGKTTCADGICPMPVHGEDQQQRRVFCE